MNGAGIGALAVQVFQPSDGGKKSILWTNSVSRGDTWLLKTLDVSLQQFTTVGQQSAILHAVKIFNLL